MKQKWPKGLTAESLGRTGILIGLISLAVTLTLGLPPFIDWFQTQTQPTRSVDARWHRGAQLSSADGWTTPTDIAYGNGRWVIVGSIGIAARPAAWYSTDGRQWHNGTVQLGTGRDTTAATLRSVVFAHGLWLGVGDATTFGHLDAAIWQSADGVNWRRTSATESTLGGPGAQGMFAVATGDSNWVAVGYENFGGDANGAIWRSGDGTHWTRVQDPGPDLGGSGDQVITSVTRTTAGLWVAAGREDKGGHSDAVVWVSRDGTTWRRDRAASELQGPRDDAIYGLASGDNAIVAVGATRLNDEVDAAIWTSGDGTRWTRVPYNRAVFGGDMQQTVQDAVYTLGSWLAIGADESSGAFNPAVWSSKDGTHWERVDNPEAFDEPRRTRLIAVAAHDNEIMVVGTRDDGVGQVAATWGRSP